MQKICVYLIVDIGYESEDTECETVIFILTEILLTHFL
jgi:hypothetical protein